MKLCWSARPIFLSRGDRMQTRRLGVEKLYPSRTTVFVAWSSRTLTDFGPDYWNALYRCFANSGTEIVAHYLPNLDLSGFEPKAPPPKTKRRFGNWWTARG